MPTEQLALRTIHLYQGTFSSNINAQELCLYLQHLLPGISIEVHQEFIQHHVLKTSTVIPATCVEDLAEKFSRIKILDPRIKERTTKPLYGEIEYEKRRLLNAVHQPSGIIYDGEKLWSLYNHFLAEEECCSASCHIALTNQLFATWNNDDQRYHARTSIYGIPSIISTRGLVEAPARSRHYYISRQTGLPQETLEKMFPGQFLTYDDLRMTEVLKGYMSQAIFYHLTGNPFCDDPGCRLFNAHWQHELLYAQLDSPYEFCPEHQFVLQCLNSW